MANKFYVSYWLAGIAKMRVIFARDAGEARAMVSNDVETAFGADVRKSTTFNVRESGSFMIHLSAVEAQGRRV